MQSNSLLIRLYKSFEKNPNHRIYLPLIIYWSFLFIATSIPIDRHPYIFKAQDKVEHLIAYFLLAVLIKLSLEFQNKFIYLKKSSNSFTLAIIIIYAMIDELHQLIIPGRYCDFFDWLADVLGGTLGILFITYIKKQIS